MTPVFCCGFECGVVSSSALGQHWKHSTAGTYDTTIKRSGARSLKLSNGVTTTINSAAQTGSTSPFSSSNIGVYRFYVYVSALNLVQAINLFNLKLAPSNDRGGVLLDVDGTVYARCGPNQAGSGIKISAACWNCIDVKVNTSANPWTTDIMVNGQVGGQATNAVAANTYDIMYIADSGIANGADIYLDDFIMSQTVGDYPIGPGYVNHFLPTSDGTHSGLTAGEFQRTLTGTDIVNATTTAFQLVDDAPLETGTSVDWINMVAPSAAADYVECIFGPPSGINTPLVAPRTIEVIAAIHQAGTGTGNMEIRLNDNGTTDNIYSATTVAGVTTIVYKRKHYATCPTGGAWKVTSGAGNFNNVRFRFGSPSGGVDANPDQYLDCIMIEAEFKEILFNKSLNINQAVNRANTY